MNQNTKIAGIGFEPIPLGDEPIMLPLHHPTINLKYF
jgi:hypothetical protein